MVSISVLSFPALQHSDGERKRQHLQPIKNAACTCANNSDFTIALAAHAAAMRPEVGKGPH